MQKFCWIFGILGILLVTSSCIHTVGGTGSPEGAEEKDENYHDDEDYGDEEEVPAHITPTIANDRLDLVVDTGKKVEFPCTGEKLGLFTIFWVKADNYLTSNDLVIINDKRFSIHSEGRTGEERGNILIIDNVTNADSGEYVCKVHRGDNVVATITHGLNVKEMPRVWAPDAKVVRENEPVSISCNASGYPQPKIYWERKGRKMPDRENVVEGREITFHSVSRHHSGVYECFANNSLGTARTALKLQVLHAPEVVIERESINSGLSRDAELVCIVHAEPKADVNWYKDGELLNFKKNRLEHKSGHHTIHIGNVQTDDFGKYVCVANNSIGKSQKAIELSGAPSQPILKESRLGEDPLSYILLWELDSAEPVVEFKLKYKKASEVSWNEVEGKPDPSQTNIYTIRYNLENLASNSDYEATLTARNKHGWSKEAKTRMFHVNGEFQSLEADTASAKGASGSLSMVPIPVSSILMMTFAFMRWH